MPEKHILMRRLKRRIAERLDGHFQASEIRIMKKAICDSLPGISGNDFYLEPELAPDDGCLGLVDGWLDRIVAGEPLQYVLGYTDFCGLRIKCDSRALIPRPETTELVEWMMEESGGAGSLLDIGTGTGCIAIAMASRYSSLDVRAWDISGEALALASENCTANNVNVKLERQDILCPCCNGQSFDVIVSNPPYIALSEKKDMENNVLEYEPHTALFVSDDDPLVFYRAIGEFGRTHLSARGAIYFEINPLYADSLAELLKCQGYEVLFRNDISGRRRMAKAYTNDKR